MPALMVGCSAFYGSQPPAPVYGSGATVYSKAKPAVTKPKAPKRIVHQPIKQEVPEIVTTKPLQESTAIIAPVELAPEPLTLEQIQGQEALASKSEPAPSAQESAAPATPPQEALVAKPTPESVVSAPKQELEPPAPPPAPPPPPRFEPLDTFGPLSPAVSALALAANQNSKSGDIEGATTTIERAIRIEPRNATLYYKLALLRLKQSKPKMAEDLAKKAVLLATNDAALKKHSWLLVARAREIQGDINGGKEARANAGKF